MVQTSSVFVLGAIAFGAVSSVNAIPVHSGTPVTTATVLPAPPPVHTGGTVHKARDNTLAAQNQALNKLKQDDARLDRERAKSYMAEAKAYEAEAQRLAPAGRPIKSTLKARAPPKAATAARPAAKEVKVATQPRPVDNGAKGPNVARPASNPARPNSNSAHISTPGHTVENLARPNTNTNPGHAAAAARPNANSPPSLQQQLASQRTALKDEKHKYATQDYAKAKEYQTEADAYRAEAQRLEPAAKKAVPPKPQTYQQEIAAQNSGLQRMETKFATEDRQRVKQMTSEASAYTNQANQFAPLPSTQRPLANVGPRDLEDDFEAFAREEEWEEYVARANELQAEMSETAPGAATEPMAESAPRPKPHNRKNRNRKAKKFQRQVEDEAEAFAREWEEFVTREWEALEELD